MEEALRVGQSYSIQQEWIEQSLRGSQVARFGWRHYFLMQVNDFPYLGYRKGLSSPPLPILLPCLAHVCLLLGPSQNGRGLKAGVGWRPVGTARLWRGRQLEWKREGSVWSGAGAGGGEGRWCRAQGVVPAPEC